MCLEGEPKSTRRCLLEFGFLSAILFGFLVYAWWLYSPPRILSVPDVSLDIVGTEATNPETWVVVGDDPLVRYQIVNGSESLSFRPTVDMPEAPSAARVDFSGKECEREYAHYSDVSVTVFGCAAHLNPGEVGVLTVSGFPLSANGAGRSSTVVPNTYLEDRLYYGAPTNHITDVFAILPENLAGMGGTLISGNTYLLSDALIGTLTDKFTPTLTLSFTDIDGARRRDFALFAIAALLGTVLPAWVKTAWLFAHRLRGKR